MVYQGSSLLAPEGSALANALRDDVRNLCLNVGQPFLEQPLRLTPLSAAGKGKLRFEARPVQPPVFFPYVIWQALAGDVVASAILT